jgi:hypothetical protein
MKRKVKINSGWPTAIAATTKSCVITEATGHGAMASRSSVTDQLAFMGRRREVAVGAKPATEAEVLLLAFVFRRIEGHGWGNAMGLAHQSKGFV